MKKIPVIFSDNNLKNNPPFELDRQANKVPYPETPERLTKIRTVLNEAGQFEFIKNTHEDVESLIRTVHSNGLIELLKLAATNLSEEEYIYPTTFNYNHHKKIPNLNSSNFRYFSGNFCYDCSTGIGKNTWQTVLSCTGTVLHGLELLTGRQNQTVYCLTRPGHHAGYDFFMGYCYVNFAFIAAHQLIKQNFRTVILDIDFHAGDGTAALTSRLADERLLTISIHGEPEHAYPFFSGFDFENTEYVLNLPLPLESDFEPYQKALTHAVKKIKEFKADFLIISAGFDTYKDETIGSFNLELEDYDQMGKRLSDLNLPSLIIQEGGYHQDLGIVAKNFLGAFNG